MMASGFQCCFCKQPICEEDRNAVSIGIANLWNPSGTQGLYAHSDCADKNLSQIGFFDAAALNSN